MRVCILTDYYYPQLGGITEHVHGQAVNLAARGHEVTIVTGRLPHAPRAADRDERDISSDDVELVHMGVALPLYGNGSQTLHTVLPLGPRRLRRFFAARRFDVVHIHAPYNPSLFMLAPFVLPAGTIGVGTYHSVFTPGRVRDLVPGYARLARRLHGHIVVSDACIEPLDHYFPEFSWRVIPNGIDEDHFAPEAEPIEELRGSGPVMLFLGRFDPRNGLGIMLEAFERGLAGARWQGAAVHRRRRAAAQLLPAPARAGGRRLRALGRARRLEPAALLRLGRRLLHALPERELRHGAARGHELRAPGRREPDLGLPAAAQDGREGLLVGPPDDPAAFATTIGHLLDAPAELTHGRGGTAHRDDPLLVGTVAAELESYYSELRGEVPRPAPCWRMRELRAEAISRTRRPLPSDTMPGVPTTRLHLAASARLDGG